MTKVKLNILGLSNSQSQTGAYALILTEEQGRRRLPIIIGAFEAQSIALQLEGLFPPRPLTHDLFHNFAVAFQINIIEINIHKLEEGVFYSVLVCEKNGEKISIDARTSDAVSLALRFKCPIFTSEEILRKAGIYLEVENDKESTAQKRNVPKSKPAEKKWQASSLKELEVKLNEAITNEDYEKASEIRDEIKKRETKYPNIRAYRFIR